METRVSSEGNSRFLQWEQAFLRMETSVSSIGSMPSSVFVCRSLQTSLKINPLHVPFVRIRPAGKSVFPCVFPNFAGKKVTEP